MKLIKTALILLLAVVSILFGITTAMERMSDADEGPTITFAQDTLELSVTDDGSGLFTGLSARDRQDGDLTHRVMIQGISKFITDHTARVTYLVFDRDGNMATASRLLHYTDYTPPVFRVTAPLVYSSSEAIGLLDRVHALDVLDGDITQSIRVSAMNATSDAEIYTVELTVTNSMGDTAQVTLPIIRQGYSAVRPKVQLSQYLVYVKQGSFFSAGSYLRTVTAPDGEQLSLRDVQIEGVADTSVPGTYYIYYRYYLDNTVGTAVLTVVVE